MKITTASYQIISPKNKEEGISILKNIENIARTCYKSYDKITDNSYITFIKALVNNQHLAMLEFGNVCVKFIIDRGLSHELVRHRIASFAQESTRWCNYSKNGIEIIIPDNLTDEQQKMIAQHAQQSEIIYNELINNGIKPQIARAVLPTCLKTELVVSTNIREWRHIFKLRTANDAHPQLQKIMNSLLIELQNIIPIVFDDI